MGVDKDMRWKHFSWLNSSIPSSQDQTLVGRRNHMKWLEQCSSRPSCRSNNWIQSFMQFTLNLRTISFGLVNCVSQRLSVGYGGVILSDSRRKLGRNLSQSLREAMKRGFIRNIVAVPTNAVGSHTNPCEVEIASFDDWLVRGVCVWLTQYDCYGTVFHLNWCMTWQLTPFMSKLMGASIYLSTYLSKEGEHLQQHHHCIHRGSKNALLNSIFTYVSSVQLLTAKLWFMIFFLDMYIPKIFLIAFSRKSIHENCACIYFWWWTQLT